MTSRFYTTVFAVLVIASAIMAGVLWQMRDRAHQRLLAGENSSPTQAPQVAPVEQATLLVANDTDGSLKPSTLSLPLPPSPTERARAILGKLLDLYAQPGSPHPVPGGAASVTQVFLLPAGTESGAARPKPAAGQSGSQLAVVNLTGAFASTHPSGIETETLTLLSICATLHANLPSVSEVRFLIDGQTRDTLAGHADLTRTYLTAGLTPDTGAAQ